MNKVVTFVQLRNEQEKKHGPDAACLEYMQEQMQDFKEFGPGYCEKNHEDSHRCDTMEILTSILVCVVFVMSVVILSLSIANLTDTKKEVWRIAEDIKQLMTIKNISLVEKLGKSR